MSLQKDLYIHPPILLADFLQQYYSVEAKHFGHQDFSLGAVNVFEVERAS